MTTVIGSKNGHVVRVTLEDDRVEAFIKANEATGWECTTEPYDAAKARVETFEKQAQGAGHVLIDAGQMYGSLGW